MKIGIMGGTFDPVHNGHLEMMKAAREALSLDLLYIIPAGNPYFKKEITPYPVRYEMMETALESIHDVRFRISDLESDENMPTYTYHTLEILKSRHPQAQLFFICGADVLETIHSWRYPEIILKLAALAVFSRIDRNQTATEHAQKMEMLARLKAQLTASFPDAACCLLEAEIPDISSTMVREKCRKQEPVDELLPAQVIQFIRDRALYQERENGTDH